jgi:hypothetical protein
VLKCAYGDYNDDAKADRLGPGMRDGSFPACCNRHCTSGIDKLMVYLTAAMATKTFATLPRTFDSHEAQRAMQRLFPAEFKKEINRFKNAKDRLHVFSRTFGRWLSKFPNQIRKTAQRPTTLTLRNTLSKNRLWEKV